MANALKPGALPDPHFWAGKRVFVTGHSGFKGSWLCLWLIELGAVVTGYALAPDTSPALFSLCRIGEKMQSEFADVRDSAKIAMAVRRADPQIILHLAAQPLVRASYARPTTTFETNIMGTVNLLDAVAQSAGDVVMLIITSDKVYAEGDSARHLETDRLGGRDPYSASKACAEMVAAAFPMPPGKTLATARSGNVIGGGDWSEDRLVPDFIRAVNRIEPLVIRNPAAIRPWQHVLDPVCGYLLAVEHLWSTRPGDRPAWNFGPDAASELPVQQIADRLCTLWGEPAKFRAQPADIDLETSILRLDSSRAHAELGWHPALTLDVALQKTVDWYKAFEIGRDVERLTRSQIDSYGDLA